MEIECQIADCENVNWKYRGKQARILDCRELDESSEQYRYKIKVDIYGETEIFWIDAKYII